MHRRLHMSKAMSSDPITPSPRVEVMNGVHFSHHAFFRRLDESARPEVLHGPVHMHRREAGRIRQLRLGDRHLEAVAIIQPDRLQPHEQLAEEVRDPLVMRRVTSYPSMSGSWIS